MTEGNLPRWLIRALVTRFSLPAFVETGTMVGETALLASMHVPLVHTIEISKDMYDKAIPEIQNNKKIVRHLGNSVELLPGILKDIPKAMFWLDGHWSGMGPRLGMECPLLGELDILSDRKEDVILIDDARMFIHPPPKPHRREEWPKLPDVIDAVRGNVSRCVCHVCDMIIATPEPLFSMF